MIYIRLLFLFLSCTCFSQINGKAYYIKKSSFNLGDNKQLNDLEPTLKNSLKTVDKSTENIEFVLSFNDSLASYKENERLISDSESDLSNKLSKILSGYQGPSYYNLRKQLIILEKEVIGKTFLVHKKMSDYNWTLAKEQLVINDLTCYKATTFIEKETRKGIKKVLITAWYTTDISIPAGPDGFAGLPGLIIQIEKEKVVTSLRKIEFSDKKNKIKTPTEGEIMTKKEFDALMKDVVMNRRKYYNKN